ncbi:MAG: hypothetical protein V3V74_07105 [Nitrosomonadaceae bacterium]
MRKQLYACLFMLGAAFSTVNAQDPAAPTPTPDPYTPPTMKETTKAEIDDLIAQQATNTSDTRKIEIDNEILSLQRKYKRIHPELWGIFDLEHEHVFGYTMFEPSARIFFDSGKDDEGEVDLFDNGKLAVNLSVAKIYQGVRFENYEIAWNAQFGMSSSNGDSGQDIPVVTVGVGMELKVFPDPRQPISPLSLEFGYMKGYSADEAYSGHDRDDGAFYVGLNVKDFAALFN